MCSAIACTMVQQAGLTRTGPSRPVFPTITYIDFAESRRCVDDGTDANCQDLDPDDIQCENLYGDAPLCSLKKLQGRQFFAMTAYNAQAESDFTPELSVRFDGADPWNIAVLSAINALLLEE